uniref:GTF3C1 n=1 Tax=Gongylonema pulchrum TaxID=637853 RepID=A0A183D3M8_9BILA
LISEQDLTDKSMECIFDQLGVQSVTCALEQLRIDGLITRQRFPVEDSKSWKTQATLSFSFRHFFNHRYHPDLMERLIDSIEDVECGKGFAPTDDTPSSVAAASKCFYTEACFLLDQLLKCLIMLDY